MIKSIIVAVAENLAIGYEGQMLWHLKKDLKYFKETTTGHPVIMGRKTWESIGRPLPGRLNIVVSRSIEATEGAVCAKSLEEAIQTASGTGCQECFIMGGAQIYSQAMPLADRLYITEIHSIPEKADTFFPDFDHKEWKEEWRSEAVEDNGIELEFVRYSRA